MVRQFRWILGGLTLALCFLSVSGGFAENIADHLAVGEPTEEAEVPAEAAVSTSSDPASDASARNQAYLCECASQKVTCYAGGFQATIPEDMEEELSSDCQLYSSTHGDETGPRYVWIYR